MTSKIRATLQSQAAVMGTMSALLLLAAADGAQAGARADFAMHLANSTPGRSTGVTFHIRFKAPGDPNAKPPPIKSVGIDGPSGLRYDSGAAPQCTASDAQLQSAGPSSCAPGSQIGAGAYTAILGFGPPVDPFVADDLVFNGPGQIIELITVKGTDRVAGLDRLTIDGSTLTAHPPDVPGGPPDGKTATRQIDFTVPARTTAGRALVTTPPSCPPGGMWTSRGTFGFADGGKETVSATAPCHPIVRPRLAVRPGRARAGHRTRYRFDLTSAGRACLSRASLTFAARRVRFDPRGHASMVVDFTRPGRRWARVHGRGCLGPGVWVQVSGR